jgi:uncharacterized protein YunC (DUF1805 family)
MKLEPSVGWPNYNGRHSNRRPNNRHPSNRRPNNRHSVKTEYVNTEYRLVKMEKNFWWCGYAYKSMKLEPSVGWPNYNGRHSNRQPNNRHPGNRHNSSRHSVKTEYVNTEYRLVKMEKNFWWCGYAYKSMQLEPSVGWPNYNGRHSNRRPNNRHSVKTEYVNTEYRLVKMKKNFRHRVCFTSL